MSLAKFKPVVTIRTALASSVLCSLLLIAAHPAQAQTESVLYGFTNGGLPYDSVVLDSAGNVYGTAYEDGLYGVGVVFELSPASGGGGWNYAVLYSFTGGLDGGDPTSSLIFDSAGNLYGTATFGGANSEGVVFELSPAGGTWTETVLYNFCSLPNCTDGARPNSGLVRDKNGNLYGATANFTNGSGTVVSGTVFELSPSENGWNETAIYSADLDLIAGVSLDQNGNIYGVVPEGGKFKSGYAFELSPTPNDGWNASVIYNFRNSSYPEGNVILDPSGNLYGTTFYGGSHNHGSVFKLTPGKDGWTKVNLHSFPEGGKDDGYQPFSAALTLDNKGNIYGTVPFNSEKSTHGGVVFELTPNGASYEETILWEFNGSPYDGAFPHAGIVLDGAGNLYGTTLGGGEYDFGTVFKLTP